MAFPSDSRATSLSHRLEYAALRVVSTLVRILPERVGQGACAALGWVAGSVLRLRRATVDANLLTAFPEASSRWRNRVARASYAHLGRETGVLLRTTMSDPGWTRSWVEARSRFADPASRSTFEWMLARSEAGQGTVIVSGHLGNWELGGSALSVRGLPLSAVAVGQANPLVDRKLRATRDRLGMKVVGKSLAATRVGTALSAGRAVAILSDQNARGAGVPVEFFGRPASTARGAALFAVRAEVPIVFAAVVREPGWPQRYAIHLERIEWSSTGDRESDLLSLTAAHTQALESRVCSYPGQYLWQHKRWRTREARQTRAEEPASEAQVLPT